jgi:hypothetical protein
MVREAALRPTLVLAGPVTELKARGVVRGLVFGGLVGMEIRPE